jgi:ABC-type lipoprotein export system ATPase subunit
MTNATSGPSTVASGISELDEQARSARAAYGADALIMCDRVVRIYSGEGLEVQALQGLDLLVAEGEMTAVVGASGSGKSTLMNILAGLDTPTAGTVRVAGYDLGALSQRERLEYRRTIVGFIWQQATRNVLPYLTSLQNVMLPMRLAGVARPERGRRAAELLETLGVADCARRTPSQLSGGEQQRVAIATALANRPRVLLADEPTGELDTESAANVFAALQTANTELGATILLVSHDPAMAARVRRVVAIRDGRTATEVLRHDMTDESGNAATRAIEYAVMDRAGRVQLPREMTRPLGMRSRVLLKGMADHIGVWADQPPVTSSEDKAPGQEEATSPSEAGGETAASETAASETAASETAASETAAGEAAAGETAASQSGAVSQSAEPNTDAQRVAALVRDRTTGPAPSAGPGEVLVAADALTRTFGSGELAVHALRGLSLTVRAGQFVTLYGRSGSGKTTLLNILGGLDLPTSGTVSAAGRDLTAADDRERTAFRRDEVAFIFQSFGLIPMLSAAENVGIPLRIKETPRTQREERVRMMLNVVGLSEHALHRPAELSGGQQQRVAIARALAGRPRLLLADEPTGQLDHETGQQIIRLLRTVVRAEGLTAIVATHDPALADLADLSVQIEDGRIAES